MWVFVHKISLVFLEEDGENRIQYCDGTNLGESVLGVWRLVRDGGWDALIGYGRQG
jgi:hypothetical protein